jgi:predicted nucleotidyltransferase
MEGTRGPGECRKIEEKRRALTVFLGELRADPEVMAVFVFGSHARGDDRPDSDIDLLVIAAGAFRKTVTRRDGVEFEIFRNNPADTVAFWRAHRDDFDGFWRDAKPLFDRDGTVALLSAAAATIRSSP